MTHGASVRGADSLGWQNEAWGCELGSNFGVPFHPPPRIAIMEASIKIEPLSALVPNDYYEQKHLFWTTRKRYEINTSWVKLQRCESCHCDKI